MRSETIRQVVTADIRRVALIYPSAVLVAIGLMVFQSASGVKIFTFDQPSEPAKFYKATPAPEILPAPPAIKEEDIDRIRDEVLQSQRQIDDLKKEIALARSDLVSLRTENQLLQKTSASDLDLLKSENAALKTKFSQSEVARIRLDKMEARLLSLESGIATSVYAGAGGWTFVPTSSVGQPNVGKPIYVGASALSNFGFVPGYQLGFASAMDHSTAGGYYYFVDPKVFSYSDTPQAASEAPQAATGAKAKKAKQ